MAQIEPCGVCDFPGPFAHQRGPEAQRIENRLWVSATLQPVCYKRGLLGVSSDPPSGTIEVLWQSGQR